MMRMNRNKKEENQMILPLLIIVYFAFQLTPVSFHRPLSFDSLLNFCLMIYFEPDWADIPVIIEISGSM